VGDKLVTVASFWDSFEADLARNRLEAAGVDAWSADAAFVGMAWQYANAVGGVKVQVRDRDVDRARAVLAEVRDGGHDSPAAAAEPAAGGSAGAVADAGDEADGADGRQALSRDPSTGEDAALDVAARGGGEWGAADEPAEPVAAPPDAADLSPADGSAGDDADDPGDPDPPDTARERAAERAYRAAVLGLLLVPLQLYVFWLVLKVFLSDDRLAPRPRRRAVVAGVICVPFVLVMLRVAVGLLAESV
jgi:hypothetical protein